MHFSRDEYLARIARTRAAMERAGIELLVTVDPSNMGWLTGYDGWSFYTPQAVLLAREGDPVWWGRGIDAPGARRTVFMEDHPHSVVGYSDDWVQNPPRHAAEELARLIEARGWGGLKIGVEMDNYYYSATMHHRLVAGLPRARFLDATGLVNWCRAVKSPAEIEMIRRAARIVEAMHERILAVAEPGMPKNVLVAEIQHQGTLGAKGYWGDYPAIVPMTPSGLDATAAHLTWDDRPLESGEATFFEIAGVHCRYHCPQSRTLFLGPPPRRYREAERAVLAGLEAGMAAARPGGRCEDVARAFTAALEAHGFSKDSRCGYSIGMSYPPDWGERTMSFRRGDRSVLKPGMVFHFMPALWLDDGGLEISEPILITEDGAERLTHTPQELFVK
ncbi:MAG: M24 family metallopeptidase [Alphaproteobacteria bacterium]|nr:MAG: M24 family metallopeptidase [Alphaproteobacteria bacterium]